MSDIGAAAGQNDQGRAQVEDEGESLRDSLVSAMKTAREADAGTTIEDKPAGGAPDGRDSGGRFAKPGAPGADKPAAPSANAGAAQPGAQEGTTVTHPSVPKAPDSWSAPMKEKFPTLAPEVQAYIAQRETDMNKKFTTQDEDRNFGKRVKDTLSPYMATIVQEGGTPEKAINELFRTSLVLRSPNTAMRQQALQQIAKQFNIPLGVPVQQGQQNPQFNSLQQRLDRIEQATQAEVQQRQSQEGAQINGLVEAFAANPENVHYEAVKPKMAALLNSGQAKDLQDAYDQATWADPEIRSTLTAAQIKAADEKRITEAQAKTDVAKRAAVSVVGGPGGAIPAQNASGSSESLRDTIRANLRAAQGGRI